MRSARGCLLVGILLLLLGWYIVPIVITRVSTAITRGQNQAWREQLATMPAEDPLSRLFVQVAAVVGPAVVEVRVAREVEVEQPSGEGDFLRRFFGRGGAPAPRQYMQRGLGSGVIVDDRNGYIVTNNHVVEGATQVQLILADGRILQTAWIRTDPATDLALVKVDAADLIAAPLGDSSDAQVGQWVLAFGAPEGLQKTVTAGIISATGRYTGDVDTYQSFLQTDAAINPGNSGGPLVNMRGEVIGINAAIVSPTGAYAGIGFAIPSDMVKNVLAQLIDKGTVTRGYLGVSIQAVTPGLARSFGLPGTQGALVTEVMPDAPAARAGLQRGDFITAVDGRAVQNPNDLRNTVAGVSPGTTVPIEFYREGQKQTAEVTIEPQPSREPGPREGLEEGTGPAGQLGLQVAPMTPPLARRMGYSSVPDGVAVVQVTPGSPADSAGLAPGMVITQVQNTAVSTPEEFEQVLAENAGAGGVRLRVTDPSGRSRYAFLSMGE
jgi:serine protease Do